MASIIEKLSLSGKHHEIMCAAGGVAVGAALTLLWQKFGCKCFGSACGEGKTVAVVLHGCGYLDGSEITEAVSAAIQIQAAGAKVVYFAPDEAQKHVVNHATGDTVLAPPSSYRNQLEESARIARGSVRPITELTTKSADAVVFVGGFGAAKNLCNFAFTAGMDYHVSVEVTRVIKSFVMESKPLGFTCIAPVIAAKLIPGVTVTLGADGIDWPYAGARSRFEDADATLVDADVTEAVVDTANKVVSTPAYMKEATNFEVFTGIGKLVKELIKLM